MIVCNAGKAVDKSRESIVSEGRARKEQKVLDMNTKVKGNE